jgi:alpha-beta hydrolase superfamily lysophospholipase
MSEEGLPVRRIAAPLVFAAAFGLLADLPRARAKAPVEEAITTADGMKLRGLFHKSPKGGATDPVVLLLYPPGVGRDMTTGNWADLIKMLNDEGFHVFQFDWRGHGKSTDIGNPAQFWADPFTGRINQRFIKGSNNQPPKNTLFAKEIGPAYFPVYVEDLAAVRVHLDQKNDQAELNTSSIYVVGAEDAATLGLLWMTAEWLRPAIHPNLANGAMFTTVPSPNVQNKPEAGRDIAAAVWLSPARPPNQAAIPQPLLATWASKTPLRDNNPMLFLYGQKDAAGKTSARFFFDEVLVAEGNGGGMQKLLDTHIRDVAGTNKKGTDLLGMNNALKTEDTAVAYLTQMRKNRGAVPVKKRNYAAPYYINLPAFGVNP